MNKMKGMLPADAGLKWCNLIMAMVVSTLPAKAQQPCNPENVHSLMGTWKNISPNFTDHTAADAAKERPLLKDIFNSIRSNFKWPLQGGEITYSDQGMMNEYSKLPLYLSRKINASGVGLIFHDFLCVNGKVQPNESTRGISVFFNDWPFKYAASFFTKTIVDPPPAEQNTEDIGTSQYYISSILPDFKNGIWDFYNGERNGAAMFTHDTVEVEKINHVYRIIAKPGIAPLIAMSKKEYFSNWIKKLQFEVTENDRQIKKISNAKDPYLDAGAKKQMCTMYEELKKNAAENISAIENVRKHLTPKQLAKPSVFHEEEGVYIETPDFLKNEFYILKLNPDYFNTQLPRASFQLCCIDFTTLGVWYGAKMKDPRYAPYHKFVEEIVRMKAFELITQKVQPLIKN